MSDRSTYQNPMAKTALLVSLIPCVVSLSMVGLKIGIGPHTMLFYISQVGGPALLALIVISSGLGLVAYVRAGGHRDLRISAAFALVLVSVLGFIAFLTV